MSDDYMTRLARDLQLKYGGNDYLNVVDEFEAEVLRVVHERAALVVLTVPQAVALSAVLTEIGHALEFYRTRAGR
jgi:hypothetical protein